MSTVSWQQLVKEAAAAMQTSLGGNLNQRTQEARWLVERVSGYSPTELFLNGSELVSARGVAFFDQLVARRCSGEPIQYVLGRWSFRSLELFVDSRVLIPRPETEIVAGLGIDFLQQIAVGRPVIAVDLGCGSGAIGLSVATEVPSASVWLCDVSEDALAVTRANLAGLGRVGTRVNVCQGSWFAALPAELRGQIDLLISNPPYIPDAEVLPNEVTDWEPGLALFGGSVGHELLCAIVDEASNWLSPGGAMVLEMGPSQTSAIADRCAALGYQVRIENDLAGKQRAVVAIWPSV
jgi:release factor glutamine methyltransferase